MRVMTDRRPTLRDYRDLVNMVMDGYRRENEKTRTELEKLGEEIAALQAEGQKMDEQIREYLARTEK